MMVQYNHFSPYNLQAKRPHDLQAKRPHNFTTLTTVCMPSAALRDEGAALAAVKVYSPRVSLLLPSSPTVIICSGAMSKVTSTLLPAPVSYTHLTLPTTPYV